MSNESNESAADAAANSDFESSGSERPSFEGQEVTKGGRLPSVASSIVVLLRVAQYALVGLAALTSMGALASSSMNAIAGAVLGVYVLVMLGFVWAIETVGVNVLQRRCGDE